MLRLDIFVDPVCPWCMIGKAHLDRALEAAGAAPFLVSWHPFRLNPDMPRGGMDRAAYLEARFGGRVQAARALAEVEAAARAAGLEVDLAAAKRQPDTLDAHRLLHWAGIEGRQAPVLAALFRAHFREGRDIGDREVLADLAAEAGLERALVARLLASEADLEEIRRREAHARARGIRAVPTFILADRHVIEGAQPPAFWAQLIAEAGGGPPGPEEGP